MSDSWHKALVYFGLAEERDGYADADDDYPEPEPEARERPNVRRLSSRRRRDEFDDIFAEEEDSPQRSRPAALRSVGGGRSNAGARTSVGEFGVHLVIPKSFNDAQQVADKFREGTPVIMNLSEMDDADAKRLVDFAAGLVFATRGTIERVTNKVFLLSPPNVTVAAEDKQRIAEGGFFNQS